MILGFYYNRGKGHKIINFDRFLKSRNLQAFKKLIELIRRSDSPELLEDLQRYLIKKKGSLGTRDKNFYLKCIVILTEG